MTTQPTPEAGADLLDRMAEVLRGARALHWNTGIEGVAPRAGKHGREADELLAEYDRLRASQAQQVAGGDSEWREFLGKLVRMEWAAWAREQPSPKPSWLTPWDDLTEPEREVDRRIGERIYNTAIGGLYEQSTHPTPEADAAAPVAPSSDAAQKVAGALGYILADDACILPLDVHKSAQAILDDYRARPAPTVATREAVSDAVEPSVAQVTSTDTPEHFSIITPGLPKGTLLYAARPPQGVSAIITNLISRWREDATKNFYSQSAATTFEWCADALEAALAAPPTVRAGDEG